MERAEKGKGPIELDLELTPAGIIAFIKFLIKSVGNNTIDGYRASVYGRESNMIDAKPLELLESHRVKFSDTLDSAYLVLKLQLHPKEPLDLQFVVDFQPKAFMSGRGKLSTTRPQPKAYLHIRQEDSLRLID
jgi:hypothetical protein